MNLKDYIRSIPDYPKKGILFRDITTLIKDKDAFSETINQIVERTKKFEPSKADLILTYNLTTRNALLNAGFIDSNKIFATGCLRYANIKKTFKRSIKKTKYKNIIFYSFQHNSIIDNERIITVKVVMIEV